MARSLTMTGGRVLGVKDGVSFFDTNAYPVQFYPPSNVISITGQTIEFPDFHHANAYGFAAGDTGGGIIKQSCQSFVSIPFQEWGPSDQPGITDNLDDAIIGTIPDGTDIRLVRIKLTRTNAPDQVNGTTVPVEPIEGEWTNCDGGSLVVEFLWPVVRMIWIRAAATSNGDGTTNLLLTRKQSISKRRYTHWKAGNSPTSTGWTYGGTNGAYGHIVKSIEAKGPTTAPGGVITYRRGDAAQCSLTDTSDFSSTYTADIEILPGRSNITPDGSGGDPGGLQFFLTDLEYIEPNSSTHTYTSKFIGPEPTVDQTRHVIVALTAYSGLDTASETISGVTINGVAATQRAVEHQYINAANDDNFVAAIYIAEVPTDDDIDIVLSFTGTFWASQIDVYAAYNLSSTTPDDVELIAAADGSETRSLTNVNPGVAVAVGLMSSIAATYDMTGIDNVAWEEFFISAPAGRQYRRLRAFQKVDGTTLSLVYTTNSGMNFCAASFH